LLKKQKPSGQVFSHNHSVISGRKRVFRKKISGGVRKQNSLITVSEQCGRGPNYEKGRAGERVVNKGNLDKKKKDTDRIEKIDSTVANGKKKGANGQP